MAETKRINVAIAAGRRNFCLRCHQRRKRRSSEAEVVDRGRGRNRQQLTPGMLGRKFAMTFRAVGFDVARFTTIPATVLTHVFDGQKFVVQHWLKLVVESRTELGHVEHYGTQVFEKRVQSLRIG